MRKNIALQSSQILYTFVLSAEIATTFAPKMDKICMPAFQRTSIICSFVRGSQKKTYVEKYFYGFGGKQKAALKHCSINNNPRTTKLVSNIKVSRCKNDNVFICDCSFVDANDGKY
jgi:hypothetical protein